MDFAALIAVGPLHANNSTNLHILQIIVHIQLNPSISSGKQVIKSISISEKGSFATDDVKFVIVLILSISF